MKLTILLDCYEIICWLNVFINTSVGDTTNQPPTLDQVEKNLAAEFMKKPIIVQDQIEDEQGDASSETSNTCDESARLEDSVDTDTSISQVEPSGDADNKSSLSELSSSSKPVDLEEPPSLEAEEEKRELLPKSLTDQYRIVCQCGAKNCRKYLF